MKIHANKFYQITILATLLGAWSSWGADSCPVSDFSPDEYTIRREQPSDKDSDFVDHSRWIKDLNTDLVVNRFFSSPDTLFNFMELVYGNIDRELAKYRNKNGLDDRAIFLLFKGGNVLRMMANEVFDMLVPEVRDLLKSKYEQYFKRSDADFSVYVDEKRLNGLDYDKIFAEVSTLVFDELGVIRQEFEKAPYRYFDFSRLGHRSAREEMTRLFSAMSEDESVSNKENPSWYQAKIVDAQILNEEANETECRYDGQYDWGFYPAEDGKNITAERLSNKTHWISNSDNRTLTWQWGSDESKTVKFSLERSKINFDVYYIKDGKLQKKPIGGELIDVSQPHREDDRLREFLDAYDQTVAEYTLFSQSDDKKLTMKAYSVHTLAEDLEFIIFDSFKRPWLGGSKYDKRVNRLFFIFIAELLTKFGTSSEDFKSYIKDVEVLVLAPLKQLLPLDEDAQEKDGPSVLEEVHSNAKKIADKWQDMHFMNHFLKALSTFAERLVKNPLDDDEEGFKNLLKVIEENLAVAKEANDIGPARKIDLDRVYQVKLKSLL